MFRHLNTKRAQYETVCQAVDQILPCCDFVGFGYVDLSVLLRLQSNALKDASY